MTDISGCFKAYDIRGRVPAQLNEDFSYALGLVLADFYKPKGVVIGHDARLSSPKLHNALAAALLGSGAEVSTLGLCGTEEIYYASATSDNDLGVMITGSHNPIDENGFKLVKHGSIPISADSGLKEIALKTIERLQGGTMAQSGTSGLRSLNLREKWLTWMLDYTGLNRPAAQSLKVVIDAGNGCAGPVLELLTPRLPIDVVPVNFEPDGSFPNGIPNPLLPERRNAAAKAVLEYRADLGIAFDGDFDRCFFFNHRGEFVETCYLAGLLASQLLMANPAEKIIHDPRVYWNTRDLIYTSGGFPQMSRSGHAFMKETLRKENALYGAEMSGHHFYRDFAYSDSGMLTMLFVIALLLRSGQTLAELVEVGESAYPCSGEVNFLVDDAERVLEAVWEKYKRDALETDRLDGVNFEYTDWRFNLRSSNTEPLLRLNIESRGDRKLIKKKLAELERFIKNV